MPASGSLIAILSCFLDRSAMAIPVLLRCFNLSRTLPSVLALVVCGMLLILLGIAYTNFFFDCGVGQLPSEAGKRWTIPIKSLRTINEEPRQRFMPLEWILLQDSRSCKRAPITTLTSKFSKAHGRRKKNKKILRAQLRSGECAASQGCPSIWELRDGADSWEDCERTMSTC